MGLLGFRAYGATSADTTTGELSADEARPPGINKHSVSTESDLAGSSGEAGPSWSGAHGTTSADVAATAVAKCADEVQPSVLAKYSATSKFEPEPGFTRLIQDAYRLLENSPLRAGSFWAETLGAGPGTEPARLPPWDKLVNHHHDTDTPMRFHSIPSSCVTQRRFHARSVLFASKLQRHVASLPTSNDLEKLLQAPREAPLRSISRTSETQRPRSSIKRGAARLSVVRGSMPRYGRS